MVKSNEVERRDLTKLNLFNLKPVRDTSALQKNPNKTKKLKTPREKS